ncbi:MAG TPA: PadR family transcriptional regulator [Thermaerobacter sp.]
MRPMTRLVLLGMLARRPMSGYEIQQYLQLVRIDQWSSILPGSIYHALKKMAAEGLVEVRATEQTGFRTRVIYAITPAGRAEYRRLLREALRTPPRSLPSDFYLTLGFVDDLTREEVVAALDEQIARLEERLRAWNEGEAMKAKATPLPDYVRAAFANGREHMEADLRFLRYLREVLPRTPAGPWQVPPLDEHPGHHEAFAKEKEEDSHGRAD